jgi:crossover junction endodeoxyribonuclease RusA
MDSDSPFPLEVLIEGIPLSLQASSGSRQAWISRVRQEALARRVETYELGFLDSRALAVTIYYFSSAPMEGDIDNIVKPIMDGLITVAYLDDSVVERVVAQKFEPDADWEFTRPSAQLAAALDNGPPVVYVRVDDDLKWRSLDE